MIRKRYIKHAFEKVRNAMGTGIMHVGKGIERIPVKTLVTGSWHVQGLGSHIMTKEGRKQQFIKLGNLRIQNGEFEFKRKYDKAVFSPYAETFTGEIVLQPNPQVKEHEQLLNRDTQFRPKTKKEAIDFMDSNLEFLVRNQDKLKEAKTLLRKSVIMKDGKFIIKNKKKLQKIYDIYSDRVTTHETRHLIEAIDRGARVETIKEMMMEEIIAEYDAMLKHDGIRNKALPRKRLEKMLNAEHKLYIEMNAERGRPYVTSDQIKRFALEHLAFEDKKKKSFEKEMHKALDKSMRFTWGGKRLAKEAKRILMDYVKRVDNREGHEMTFEEHVSINDLFEKTNKKVEDKVMKKTKFDDVANEVRQNLNTLEMMHNNGASFEEIRAKILRIKEKKPQARRVRYTPTTA